MIICDPLDARQRFNRKPIADWGIALAVFIPLVFVLQWMLPFLIADLIAIVAVFCMFFFYLQKRAIGIQCTSCGKLISANTPWICGNRDKHCRNDQVDDFPFIYKCQHCGSVPKAYQCHHCGKLVFLSEDKQTAGYARCADLPVEKKPDRQDTNASKEAEQTAQKANLQHDLEVIRLQAEIERERVGLEMQKPKSVGERLRSRVRNRTELEDEVKRLKLEADKEFAGDSDGLEKRYREIDDEAKELL